MVGLIRRVDVLAGEKPGKSAVVVFHSLRTINFAWKSRWFQGHWIRNALRRVTCEKLLFTSLLGVFSCTRQSFSAQSAHLSRKIDRVLSARITLGLRTLFGGGFFCERKFGNEN